MSVKSTEEILRDAKKASLKDALDKTTVNFEKRWQRIAPLFEDYLNGMLVSEVCKKYDKNTMRTEFYNQLRHYHIPQLADQSQARVFASRINRGMNRVKRIKQLEECNCFTCRWIRMRIEFHAD